MTQTLDYTILGAGAERQARQDGLSALVLERGAPMYRDRLFASLAAAGIQRIILVGAQGDTAKAERMSRTFPGVRILMPSAPGDPEAMLNLGMRELGSGKALVLWSDQRLGTGFISTRLMRRIHESNAVRLCPAIRDAGGGILPTVRYPEVPGVVVGLRLPELKRSEPLADAEAVLGFDDLAGIYDVRAFLALGGFDLAYADRIARSIDFCIAARAAGRAVSGFPALELRIEAEPGDESRSGSIDARSLARLWLKHASGTARGLTYFRFVALRRGIAGGSLREFREIRSWRERQRAGDAG